MMGMPRGRSLLGDTELISLDPIMFVTKFGPSLVSKHFFASSKIEIPASETTSVGAISREINLVSFFKL